MVNDGVTANVRARARSRRHTRRLQALILVVVDLFVIGLATQAAVFGRENITWLPGGGDVDDFVRPLAIALNLVWVVLIALFGGYSTKQFGVGTVAYRRALLASGFMFGTLGVGAYLFQYPLSRGFFFLLFMLGIPLLIIGRFLLRRALHAARRAGHATTPVLIAGDLSHVEDVSRVLCRETWLGYQVVGALVSDSDSSETSRGLPILGSPDDALQMLRATGSSAVVFTEGAFGAGHEFNSLARDFEGENAELILVPALTDVSAGRMDIRPVAGMPLVHVETPRAQEAGRWLKRTFDLVGSTLLIIVGFPIMLAVAVAIKIDDPKGPVFFKQVRAGLKGEPFECFKFRSMVTDAEERLAALKARNEADGVLFKMTDDPRITRVGKFIRRFSLDELPQLFNVWLGDMSLVGPRPALMDEVARYKDHVRRRLDVRPGMTGLWQVSGRSDLSWDDTVRLDLYYVDNWSMLQDIVILFRTFGAVVGKHGAY